MKRRRSCSSAPCDCSLLMSLFEDDELEVSETLLQVPRIIFESQNRSPSPCLFTWGIRKKRSLISSSSSPTPLGSTCMDLTSSALPNASGTPAASTPLSFSPSESENRSNRCKTSLPYQKEDEDWPKMVMTDGKELLKELSACIEREGGEGGHSQPPSALPLPLHSAFGSKMCGGQVNGAGPGFMMGRGPPSIIPDLNVSPDEEDEDHLSFPPPPPDLSLNTSELKRIATAEARKRRLQIYRVKKGKGLPHHTNPFLKQLVLVLLLFTSIIWVLF